MKDNVELFSLGEIYVSDFLKEGQYSKNPKAELKLVLEVPDGTIKLDKIVSRNLMYGKYWYRSGINNSMKKELSSIVHSVLSLKQFKQDDLWIDIASNDGTLLSFIPNTFKRLGIDPADETFANEARNHADEIIQDYFTFESFSRSKFKNKKAKVITSIAMFYDLENPIDFIQDITKILDDDGLWVLQLSYTPLMLKQLAFDNICHEHIYYYSLFNIKTMFEKCGLKIMDVQLNDTNGGSFRLYVMKNNSKINCFSSKPYRDVCEYRIDSILEYEKTLQLDNPQTWKHFFERINSLKNEVFSFITEEKKKGKTIWGYGASTKGNTLLQYFGLDNTLIDGIAERSPYKYGTRTIGTNIPIFSEDDMRKIKPDYLLILPWHFINEFVVREENYLKSGGKFIIPCPEFKIIGE